MNSTVSLSFRYLESDYVRALRAHYASRLHLRVDVVVVIVLAGIGACLWRSPGDHWLGVGCVLVAALFALMLVAAFTVIPRIAFRLEPKFRDDYTLTFTQDGLHFRTVHIDSKLQWSMYPSALVDAHSYVLYYGSRHFTVIPKRAFQSTEDQQTFERMLAQHVPRVTRRDT